MAEWGFGTFQQTYITLSLLILLLCCGWYKTVTHSVNFALMTPTPVWVNLVGSQFLLPLKNLAFDWYTIAQHTTISLHGTFDSLYHNEVYHVFTWQGTVSSGMLMLKRCLEEVRVEGKACVWYRIRSGFTSCLSHELRATLQCYHTAESDINSTIRLRMCDKLAIFWCKK